MNSRKLWHILLFKQTTHPLLMRTDPHIPEPIYAVWNGWTVYVFATTVLLTVSTPFLSLTDGLALRIVSLLIIATFIPVGVFYFIGIMVSPYTLFIGVIQGFNTCVSVGTSLGRLYNADQIDMMSVTPHGRSGIYEAVGAAVVRVRNDDFYVDGVYARVRSHFILTLGLMAGVSVVIAAGAPPNALFNSDVLAEQVLLAAYQVVPMLSVTIIGTALVHLDFRQLLTLGVTAGIFGTVRFHDLFGAQAAAGVTFSVVLMSGSLTIAVITIALTQLAGVPNPIATGAGYGLALLLREGMIVWMWGEIEGDTSI
ncbi:MAG: hypothetical protein AAFV33_25405 [Chloroflexota bacterium]